MRIAMGGRFGEAFEAVTYVSGRELMRHLVRALFLM